MWFFFLFFFILLPCLFDDEEVNPFRRICPPQSHQTWMVVGTGKWTEWESAGLSLFLPRLAIFECCAALFDPPRYSNGMKYGIRLLKRNFVLAHAIKILSLSGSFIQRSHDFLYINRP